MGGIFIYFSLLYILLFTLAGVFMAIKKFIYISGPRMGQNNYMYGLELKNTKKKNTKKPKRKK
jgi:hypothetical protein